VGLRDLKKRQTREQIIGTAARLFAERGFEHVTVADVAREAQVSLATVFNYFAGKEDLFYSPLDDFGDRLVDAVRGRPAGEPAVAAFRRQLEGTGGLLQRAEAGDADAVQRMRTVHQVIADSPALQARESQAFARTTARLAGVLAETADEDAGIRAAVVAHALMGVHRALVDYVRRRVLSGDLAHLDADVRRHTAAAFTLIETGLAGA
jgi:AcrR family transcriptional regulator